MVNNLCLWNNPFGQSLSNTVRTSNQVNMLNLFWFFLGFPMFGSVYMAIMHNEDIIVDEIVKEGDSKCMYVCTSEMEGVRKEDNSLQLVSVLITATVTTSPNRPHALSLLPLASSSLPVLYFKALRPIAVIAIQLLVLSRQICLLGMLAKDVFCLFLVFRLRAK